MVPASWADAEKHKAGSLDGKTFVGEMGEKGQGNDKAEKDSFVFTDGTFRSTGCDRYGFTPTVYATKTENVAVSFEAVSTSPKEGKMTWKGKASGGMIEGTAVWEKEGQKPIELLVQSEREALAVSPAPIRFPGTCKKAPTIAMISH